MNLQAIFNFNNYPPLYSKDVSLPTALQRAMAAEAEASREARAKVIAAEGEMKSSRALKEASDIMCESPAALQVGHYIFSSCLIPSVFSQLYLIIIFSVFLLASLLANLKQYCFREELHYYISSTNGYTTWIFVK